MRKMGVWLVIFVIIGAVPVASAKTHKDNYNVSCDVLWPAVKDAVRNSGKYGILGIDNNEMSISYVIGGTLGGKRINSVVLNRLSASSCEMQTQTAYSGLIHNDAGDFKERVSDSLKKLQAAGGQEKPAPAPQTTVTKTAEPPVASAPPDLKKGMTPEDVEKLAGKTKDSIKLKDSLVYIYPAYKVLFDNGQLTEVQTQSAVGE